MAELKGTFAGLKTGGKVYIYARGTDHGTNPRTAEKVGNDPKTGEWKAVLGNKKGDTLILSKEETLQSKVEKHGLTYSTKAIRFK